MMTSVLSLQNISKAFNNHLVVADVSLDLHAGECLALVGHNGAGKTTIFKMALGLIKPTLGDITVFGRSPGASDVIGFLPESVSFYASLTGREHLRFFAKLRKVEAANLDQLLNRVGLEDASDRAVGGYSKGMRQRLGLAQALIGNPKLLILDEPTSGLDPSSRRRFYRMLDNLREEGTTIILSSHALSEVEAYTSDVAILRDGKLLAHGPLAQLARQASLPVTLDVILLNGTTLPKLDEFPELKSAVNNGVAGCFTIEVKEERKLALLHALSGMCDVVADIHIHPPTLDDVYSHFQGSKS